MPYTKTAWVNGTTAVSQANLNNLETQYDEATLSFGLDTLSAFVLLGGVGTIHGGLPKQMDVTQCIYYALQADFTYRRRVVNATNFTTVTASATYFLDYNPDGSTSWATSHSGVTNYVPIASVTTDGSGNISVITDARPTSVNLFPSAIGLPGFAGKVILQRGTHSGVAFTLSAGNGAPGTLDANEIYFQLT